MRKKRRRLTGEEARARILGAASQRLRKVGPDGLRLTRLAKELGISHPAILHHFGSREGLVAAVVRSAIESLHGELVGGLRVLDDPERGAGVLLQRAFEVLEGGGFGRLLVWLALSKQEGPVMSYLPVSRIAEAIHELRSEGREDAPELEDTVFVVLTATFVVLGMAVFGDAALRSAGYGEDPEAKERFHLWFRDVLLRLLDATPTEASPSTDDP